MGKVMTGARAKVGVVDPGANTIRYYATVESISYGMQIDTGVSYVLGRWSCAAIDYTAVEVIQINMTGWRVVDHGPHVEMRIPRVQDLLQADYLTIVVHDRQTLKNVATIRDVRLTGYSGGFAARQLSQLSVSALGTLVDDELSDNAEPADSVSLP